MAEEDYYPSSSSDFDGETSEDDYEIPCIESDQWEIESLRTSVVSVITKESLLVAQREVLKKVMDFLALSEQHARTLLICYRWDVERVFEMLERKGKERLFREVGIIIGKNKGTILSSSSSLLSCGICFDDVSPGEATIMDCGHYFCNDCWTNHFIVRIEEGQSRRIRCMASNCNAICDEAIVRGLVRRKNPIIAEKFERFLLESYVDDNIKVKWCPSIPHCGNAIRVDGDLHCEIECTCGLQFCFSCSSRPHSPCPCLIWDLWSKKCDDESANAGWITVHTKPCPKCRKAVEKNGGCNLVRCICGQAFCWLCGGATGLEHTWSDIVGHSCNSYKSDEYKLKAQLAKKNHYRFVHYHDRYKAHTDSLNQESDLKKALHEKIMSSENRESKYKDYSWAVNAMNRLFKSRRVLSYTYPFAFYMFGDELFKNELSDKERKIKQALFEDQQQQLECNVEKLSMLLEKDLQCFTDEEVCRTKIKILDLLRILDFLCMQMYQCIENELLEPLGISTYQIAPYKSNGLERALKLSLCLDSDEEFRK